jgi:hypothetical protein
MSVWARHLRPDSALIASCGWVRDALWLIAEPPVTRLRTLRRIEAEAFGIFRQSEISDVDCTHLDENAVRLQGQRHEERIYFNPACFNLGLAAAPFVYGALSPTTDPNSSAAG